MKIADRPALIRLASKLPVGNEARRVILAALDPSRMSPEKADEMADAIIGGINERIHDAMQLYQDQIRDAQQNLRVISRAQDMQSAQDWEDLIDLGVATKNEAEFVRYVYYKR